MGLLLGGGAEDEDVLAGEGFDDLGEGEGGGFEFLAGLGDGHFVFGADGDGGVFFAVFEQDEAAGGFEGAVEGGEHSLRVGEFMVDVDHEGEVDLGVGEAGVGGEAEDGRDVGEMGAAGVGGELVEHHLLDVDGVDLTGGADAAGHAEGHVAGAGADVGDGHAGFKMQGVDGFVGLFFGGAFGAVEPGGAGGAHDGGDVAAADGVDARILPGKQGQGEAEGGGEAGRGHPLIMIAGGTRMRAD